MIDLLWFDTRYLDDGLLKNKSFKSTDEFGLWYVKNYKHVHVVDIKVIENE